MGVVLPSLVGVYPPGPHMRGPSEHGNKRCATSGAQRAVRNKRCATSGAQRAVRNKRCATSMRANPASRFPLARTTSNALGSHRWTPATMVLYVFNVRHTGYVNVGFTAGCPWACVWDGLWREVHPRGCCNLLGWDNLELLHLFPGELADIARLQAQIPPKCGEFWHVLRLDELRRALTDMAAEKGCTMEEAELPLPLRPDAPPYGRGERRSKCCGGCPAKCFGCKLHFKQWAHLQAHEREGCPASDLRKVDCTTCGAKVIQRHLKCHKESSRCLAARVPLIRHPAQGLREGDPAMPEGEAM